MKEITCLTGDATAPEIKGSKIIAHICNDIGAWGKGFVMAISNRWPEPESKYKEWQKKKEINDFDMGAVQFVQVEEDLWVANMVGQHDVQPTEDGPPIRYDAVEECLGKVVDKALSLNATVHMPRIGCGLAGGRWEEIEPIIILQLCSKKIEVYVYDRG